MILKGEIRTFRSNTCSSATLFLTYPTLTALQSNPDFPLIGQRISCAVICIKFQKSHQLLLILHWIFVTTSLKRIKTD